jgi:hypothetical protein
VRPGLLIATWHNHGGERRASGSASQTSSRARIVRVLCMCVAAVASQSHAQQKMYWTDPAAGTGGAPAIRRADLSGAGVEDLITSGLSYPEGIALDLENEKMYFVDNHEYAIKRANLDGTGLETLFTVPERPQMLALDLPAGRLYWSASATGAEMGIWRARPDGSEMEEIVDIVDLQANVVGIAVDSAASKVYWVEGGANRIRRASVDGSDVEDLITTGLHSPQGIAIDTAAGKMYWTDGRLGTPRKIRRANLDGSQVEDLVTTGLSSPWGIALDPEQGKMYWVDFGAAKIRRANLDGTGVEDLVTTGLYLPLGIALDLRPPAIPADLDLDGDVDEDDLTVFQTCRTGAGVPYDDSCQKADLDADGDVDMDDFGIFQRCYSGEDVPADPGCAD